MLRESIPKWLVIVLFATLMAIPVLIYVTPVHADGATLWTDKQDYLPEETVTIHGSGFTADAAVTITVLRPDGATDTLSVGADSTGAFSTTYQLDGITGTYTVTATDGTNTATTTFTDATQVETDTTLDDIATPLTPGQTDVSWSGHVDPENSAMPPVPDGQTVKLEYASTDDETCDSATFSQLTTTTTTTILGVKGKFSATFTAPAAGTYFFRAHFPATGNIGGYNWRESKSSDPPGTCQTITVTAATGSISGKKLVDTNGDGTLQATETTGVGSVTINLYNSPKVSAPIATTTTAAADGSYTFSKTAGTYVVCEIVPTGYISTTPEVKTEGEACSSDIVLGAGQAITQNFGNFELGTVSGQKFEDVNGNGFKDDGATGLSDWQIQLTGTDKFGNAVSLSATTDMNGDYSIEGIPPGTGYQVCEDLQDGWIETYPGVSEDGTSCYTVTIDTSGQIVTGKDFGNFKLGTISGVKFEDLNANGVKDDGEPGLNGWTVTIEGTDTLTGEEVDTSTVTATVDSVDGFYSFTGLTPGTYTVCEVLKPDWIQTAPTSACYTVEISTSGQTETAKDFGNVHVFSRVTDSSFCVFDVDSKAGQQFRLIFTPYLSLSKLAASNPGQFYDNVVFYGNPGDLFTLSISVPYPFVTQGAVPVHVFDGFLETTNGFDCVSPGTGTDVTTTFTITGPSTMDQTGAAAIFLDDYSGTFETTLDITVDGSVPSSGVVYVTIHLDYGLKGSDGWSKSGTTPPIQAQRSGLTIDDPQPYDFDFDLAVTDGTLPTEYQTVQSENVFKKDPGFAGFVSDSNLNPVAGVQVQVYDPTGKLLGTVYTDQDGWYMFQYKYTGKLATFTVKLPAYGQSKPVPLKSNSVVQVDFQV